jgi:hypothetical protein
MSELPRAIETAVLLRSAWRTMHEASGDVGK